MSHLVLVLPFCTGDELPRVRAIRWGKGETLSLQDPPVFSPLCTDRTERLGNTVVSSAVWYLSSSKGRESIVWCQSRGKGRESTMWCHSRGEGRESNAWCLSRGEGRETTVWCQSRDEEENTV